ncbi:MAG: biopolymer transporter ExbD [Pseudomonadota bacterium]
MSLRNKQILRRRRLSLTSLIDIIFLLLMFFMLSSTFTKYVEVPLLASQASAAPAPQPPQTAGAQIFLRLAPEAMTLNGIPVVLDALVADIAAFATGATLLISVASDVTTQRLTQVLTQVQQVPGLSVQVLE